MDLGKNQSSESSIKSSSATDSLKNFVANQQFIPYDSQQHQKWDTSTNLSYNTLFHNNFSEFQAPLEPSSSQAYDRKIEIKRPDQFNQATTLVNNNLQGWDPRVMLSNLSFLEQKIHQLQNILQTMISQEGQLPGRLNEHIAHQQFVTADLTSIIIQLISTAGTLLPSSKNSISVTNPLIGQLGSILGSNASLGTNVGSQQNEVMATGGSNASNYGDQMKEMSDCGGKHNDVDQDEPYIITVEGSEPLAVEESEMKDYEDATEGENLPPGSYEVLQLEKEEILAPHTHFCSICAKGFKRDANLRMHMRGHGDEYKTPAALAKPTCKESSLEPVLIKRYSCPCVGCKRNKDHKKFQPLKTILCVKNHYKRSHCDKSYTCSRCNSKKFSVIADLKTHEKHCGRDKWLCSCGTTFSRKDKLFGHVALFQGHTPVLPADEIKGPASDQGQHKDSAVRMESKGFDFKSTTSGSVHSLNMKVDDDHDYFSQMNFDSCNFGGIQEFPRPAFEIPESSFSFLPSGSCNFVQNTGENLSSDVL